MEIRNNAEALKAFLGVGGSTAAQSAQVRLNDKGNTAGAISGDHATLSRAGSEVAQSASETIDRADKVAAIQQAIAAGSYKVPASAVAGKVIDSMIEARTERKA